jgi:DNA-binding response OmpR family regulator
MLVAEDNSLNSELRDWLEGEGSDVLIVSDLHAAFAAVRAQRPSVVLPDENKVPGGD